MVNDTGLSDQLWSGHWDSPAALAKEMLVWIIAGTVLESLAIAAFASRLSLKLLFLGSIPYLLLLVFSTSNIVAAFANKQCFPLCVSLRGPLGVFILFTLVVVLRRARGLQPASASSQTIDPDRENEARTPAPGQLPDHIKQRLIGMYYCLLGTAVTAICIVIALWSISELLSYDQAIFRSRIEWIVALTAFATVILVIVLASVGLAQRDSC